MSQKPKLNDVVVLSITGNGVTNSISGWTDVKITRGIDRIPGSFEISASEPIPGFNQVIALPGMSCTVDIGGDRVITGYIDRLAMSLNPEEHALSITGRGKCQDLVDCACWWPGGQFLNQTALQIAQNVAKPFGIGVRCDNPGIPFPSFCVNIGETAFALIERACRLRGLLCYEDENGDLVLGVAGTEGTAGGVEEGVNVEDASVIISMDQRFSVYSVIPSGVAFMADSIGEQSLSVYDVTDADVGRFRPKFIGIENGDANHVTANLRAIWESNRRFGLGNLVSVRIDSWRDLDGNLWIPNTNVPLHLPTLKIVDKTLLVGEVTYSMGLDGKHCSMKIMPSEAFGVEPMTPQGDQDVLNALYPSDPSVMTETGAQPGSFTSKTEGLQNYFGWEVTPAKGLGNY